MTAQVPHKIKVRVYYEDTDAGGVVYHANFLKFMERGRTEALTEIGHDPARYHNEGLFFVVTHIDLSLKKPAHLGDTLEVGTEIYETRRASVVLKQTCMHDDTLVAEAQVTVAFVNEKGRPVRMPPELAQAMEKSIE